MAYRMFPWMSQEREWAERDAYNAKRKLERGRYLVSEAELIRREDEVERTERKRRAEVVREDLRWR